MAEHLRTGVIDSQQRAATRVFEGRPVEFFPGNCSLPPPADPPKRKPQKQEPHKKRNRDGLVLRPILKNGPKKGKLSWQLPLEQEQRILQMLQAGVIRYHIALEVGVSATVVNRMSRDLQDGNRTAPVQTAQPVPGVAAEAPAARTPAPRPSAEGPRLHVLDWAAKFAAIEFSALPEQLKPRKSKTPAKACTPAQLRHLMRSNHSPSSTSEVNAHTRKSPPITNLHTRPSVLAHSIAQLFG